MSEATEFVQIAKNAQLRAELEEVSLKLATIREILFEFMNKNFI